MLHVYFSGSARTVNTEKRDLSSLAVATTTIKEELHQIVKAIEGFIRNDGIKGFDLRLTTGHDKFAVPPNHLSLNEWPTV